MTEDPIEHRTECAFPQVSTFVGKLGDRIARCETCGRVVVLEAQVMQAPPRLPRLVPPMRDGCDTRQAGRTGDAWPTHRARRRRSKRRARQRRAA